MFGFLIREKNMADVTKNRTWGSDGSFFANNSKTVAFN